MDLSEADVEAVLEVLVSDLQVIFGGQVNSLVVAVRNRSPRVLRAALLCLVSIAVDARPDAPMSRWIPGGDEGWKLYFRALRPAMLAFLNDERREALDEFLAKATLFWRIVL